jgi:hypothetical protein
MITLRMLLLLNNFLGIVNSNPVIDLWAVN